MIVTTQQLESLTKTQIPLLKIKTYKKKYSQNIAFVRETANFHITDLHFYILENTSVSSYNSRVNAPFRLDV